MTREEAVIILDGFKSNPLFNSTHARAFDMAISALSENKGDLISRQAVLDALKEHRALYCDNTPDTFSKLSYAEKSRVDEIDTAIATIVNLPSVENKGEWIPVSERLPEKNIACLVAVGKLNLTQMAMYSDLMGTITHRIFYQGDVGYDSFVDITEYVNAWQPLPEPYKAEKGSD